MSSCGRPPVLLSSLLLCAGIVLGLTVRPAPAQPPPAAVQSAAAPELLDAAQNALDSGNLDEAVRLLREVLRQDEKHRLARQALVDVLMRRGEWNAADTEINTLLRLFADDADSVYLAAAAAFRRNQFEQAVQHATRVLELAPGRAAAFQLRAFSRFMLEDYDGFRQDLESLIAVNPAHADAHYHLGRFYYENQQFTEGLAALEKAVTLDPNHYRAHYFLGWCRQAQGDLESAEASYRRSVEVVEAQQIRYGWPFTDLGELLVGRGDYTDGLGWMYRGIRNNPELPYAHYKYASALMKETPTSEVEIHLLKAVELDPGYTEAYYLLGRYYQASGENEKAKSAFAKFQELRQNPVASPYGVRRGR